MPRNETESPVARAIFERRSVRHFSDTPVERPRIMEAVRAASWAPSGLNNQPWRFAVLWDKSLKDELASLTRYSSTIRAAAVLVAVFMDRETSYDHLKDSQAIGACIQNLLLALHEQGLGAVWIGEILKNGDKVVKFLQLPERLELMAVVAVGEPAHRNQSSHRRPIEELIVFEK